jgi:hypothetical protein
MKLRKLGGRLLGGVLLLCSQPGLAEIVVVDGEPLNLRQAGVNIRRTSRTTTTASKTNAPAPVIVARTEDAMSFLNGDKLRGKLVSVDGAGGLLTWQHKAAAEVTRYQVAALDKVDLLPRPAAGQQPQQSIVQLVNGDRLRGDVVTLNGKQLVLKTWYAGTLNIEHPKLAEISPAAAPLDVLYEGPTADLAGWTSDSSTSSGLAVRNGGLVLPLGRPIGRKIPNMPEKVRFEFELVNNANSYFMFWFFCDSPRNTGGSDAYYMNFYSSRIEFQRMNRNEGNRSLGSVDGEDRRMIKSKVLVTILADRKERRFALLLDGKLVREFTDPQEFKGTGDCIMFQTHQASAMRISKIKIARWDGKLPRQGGGSSGVAAGDQDTLEFINGDAMSGSVRAIETNNIKFATSYATLDVPLERVVRMRFANKLPVALPVVTNTPTATNAPAPAAAGDRAAAEVQAVANIQVIGNAGGAVVVHGGQMLAQAAMPLILGNGMVVTSTTAGGSKKPVTPAGPVIVYPPGSTRCFFNDQEALTLKIEKIADESVTGTAEGVGALKMPLGAFSRLEFNLGAKRSSGDDDDDL